MFRVKFRCREYCDDGLMGWSSDSFPVRNEDFEDIEKAKKFARKIKRLSQEDHQEMSKVYASEKNYVCSGYVSGLIGLFEITQKELSVD